MSAEFIASIDIILLDIGFIIESLINMTISFFNSFQYFLLAIMGLSMMWAMFLLFDINRKDVTKERLRR